MSLKNEAQGLELSRLFVAYRPPAEYAVVPAGTPIFTIVGGPVYITGLFFHCATEALVALTEITIDIGNVIIDAGAAVCATAVGGTFMFRLGVAGGAVAGISNPMPVLAGHVANAYGMMATPDGAVAAGDNQIVAIFSAADTGVPITWYCVFRKMTSWSNIIVA